MNFRQLAVKNVQGSRHRYVAFFLSSTFSVLIFFLFASFIFHPDVIHGHIRAADKVRQGLVACEYIIVIFSFFFVMYASFAFLRSRKKEFGLLTLIGMTRAQIYRLMLYENMTIAVLSLAAGIGIGMLFSKLFFMALARLLEVESPIRFYIPPKALLYTCAGFLSLFLIMTLLTMLQVGRSRIVTLLKAAKQPKKPPVFSVWLILLTAACLIAGYALAYITGLQYLLQRMLLILLLVITGTYFLFTQVSVAALRALQQRKSFYYKQTHLITVSQLVFKMKDNARILFMVSILSAVILTASGTLYVFHQDNRNQMMDYFPQTIGFTEKGLNAHRVISPEQVKAVLEQDRIRIAREVKLTGVIAEAPLKGFRTSPTKVLLVSSEDYNRAAEGTKRRPLQVNPGHAVFGFPFPDGNVEFTKEGESLPVTLTGEPVALQMDRQSSGAVINRIEGTSGLLVVHPETLRQLAQRVPDQQKIVYYGFELEHWEKAGPAVTKIEAQIPDSERKSFVSRIEPYLLNQQTASLTLFIGLFVSFLFFIASGSMLYFKLFTELQDDYSQFKALMRIGVSLPELRRILSLQIGLLFFIPVIVGAVHAAFAMKTLANLMSANVWGYGITVISIFALMQGIYFMMTQRAYMKRLRSL